MTCPFPEAGKTSLPDEGMSVSSGQDCTGLIPANPDDESIESYDEMYDFLPKAVSDGKNDGVHKQ